MPSPLKTQCRICKVEGYEGDVMKWGMSLCKQCFNYKIHCMGCGTSLDSDEYGTCRYCTRDRDEYQKEMDEQYKMLGYS